MNHQTVIQTQATSFNIINELVTVERHYWRSAQYARQQNQREKPEGNMNNNANQYAPKQNSNPQVREDRPPPHDYELEKTILGAILYEPESLEYALDILGSASGYFDFHPKGKTPAPPVFHRPAHQRIYSCLCELAEADTKIDMLSISSALRAKDQLDDIGGSDYLMELADGVATAANIEQWCKMLRNMSILRNLIHTCDTIKEKCHTPSQEVGELLDEVEKEILEVGSMNQKSAIQPLKDIIMDKEEGALKYLKQLVNKDESVAGIPTGYSDLDKLITGLKAGEMFVLAARPSIGKTSFALNLMTNVAMRASSPENGEGPKRCSVGFFSLEMTAKQLAVRLICTESGFSEREIYAGEMTSITKITTAATNLNKAEMYIDPTPALKIRELRSKARKMKSQHQVDVIFIDYLQLMKAETRSDNRQEEVSAISSGIKSLAKELDIPIVVLAQLNREVEKTHGEPKLSHLRESGAIEQDADIVAFLHRDREEQKEQESSEDANIHGLDAKLIIEKNRNGRTGYVDLLFFPRLTRFTSKSRIDDADVPR